jgi:hypothetical protein
MSRSLRSARAAGSSFERREADYLVAATGNDTIDRMVKAGAKDKGDIANFKINGHRIALECKDVSYEHCTKCGRQSGLKLPEWVGEARSEAKNYGALTGFVILKRRGIADPSKQWLIGTTSDLVALHLGIPQE